MPLYRWSSGAIAQMECTSADGRTYAVLRPQAGADPAQLSALRDALTRKKITSFAGTEQGGSVLILPDVENENKLLELLASGGWSHGTPQVVSMHADKKAEQEKKGFIERNPTLMAAIWYDMGSLSWVISGIQRARHNRNGRFTSADMSEAMVGVLSASGNVLLTAYGSDAKKHPMQAFSDALGEHLQKQGIELPGPGATPDDIHRSGFFTSADDFLNKNVVSTMALGKAAAGLTMMHAATKPGNFNAQKLGAGMLFTSAWLATFLLDKPDAPPYEFKPDNPETPSTGGQMFQWAAENPRGRITAPVSGATQFIKLWGAWDEGMRFHGQVDAAKSNLAGKAGKALQDAQAELRYADAKKYDYLWNVVGGCSFLMGNYMFGKSGEKKERIPDFDRFQQEMMVVAANTLASVPDNVRQQAIGETADYIARIRGVSRSREEIAGAINAGIGNLRQNAFTAQGQGGAPVM